MLKYKWTVTAEGLHVRFVREASWMSPIAAAILLTAVRYFGLSVVRLTNNSKGLLVGIGLYLSEIGAGLIVMAAGFVLAADLRRYRCLFSPTSITLTVCYLGIPIKKLAFERDEIHKFGWGHRSHISSSVFRFAASGQRYYLAFGVAEHEADKFIEFLASNGITYSSEEEPLQRRTTANSLLG